MSIASTSFEAFERCLEPVLGLLSEEQVNALIDFRGSPELKVRMAELFNKSNEGELSDREREEYEGYIRANNYLAILQAKARRVSDGKSA
jgi:hypothetical protein